MANPQSYKLKNTGSVPVSPTMFFLLLIWWFAVITSSGTIAYFEYVKESSCQIFQRRYSSIGIKVTSCLWKEEHERKRS